MNPIINKQVNKKIDFFNYCQSNIHVSINTSQQPQINIKSIEKKYQIDYENRVFEQNLRKLIPKDIQNYIVTTNGRRSKLLESNVSLDKLDIPENKQEQHDIHKSPECQNYLKQLIEDLTVTYPELESQLSTFENEQLNNSDDIFEGDFINKTLEKKLQIEILECIYKLNITTDTLEREKVDIDDEFKNEQSNKFTFENDECHDNQSNLVNNCNEINLFLKQFKSFFENKSVDNPLYIKLEQSIIIWKQLPKQEIDENINTLRDELNDLQFKQHINLQHNHPNNKSGYKMSSDPIAQTVQDIKQYTDKEINYQSGIYSLGKTIMMIFEKTKTKTNESLHQLGYDIKRNIFNHYKNNDLFFFRQFRFLVLKNIPSNQQYFYLKKINKILCSNKYKQNIDIPEFSEYHLDYLQILLELQQNLLKAPLLAIAQTYQNIGNVYLNLNNFKTAFRYLQLAQNEYINVWNEYFKSESISRRNNSDYYKLSKEEQNVMKDIYLKDVKSLQFQQMKRSLIHQKHEEKQQMTNNQQERNLSSQFQLEKVQNINEISNMIPQENMNFLQIQENDLYQYQHQSDNKKNFTDKDNQQNNENNQSQQSHLKEIWIQSIYTRIELLQNKNKQFLKQKNQDLLIKHYMNQIMILEQFLTRIEDISIILKERKYFFNDYIDQGGEGLIFSGYQEKQKGVNEDVVFKVLFGATKQEIEDEVKIMNLFEININSVEYYELIQVSEDTFILVFEKCQCSLENELKKMEDSNIMFSQMKLFKIIFDLLDGIIQFRIYNIVHLDIKPQNILLSDSGNYVYSDFGMSSQKIGNHEITLKGYTKYFAPIELKEKNTKNINYLSDIYSLGKTLMRVIQVYKNKQREKKKFDQNYSNQDKDKSESKYIIQQKIIQKLEQLVNDNMIQENQVKRKDCIALHKLFYDFFIKYASDFNKRLYSHQIEKILKLKLYDIKKDIQYFSKCLIYYNKIYLDLQQNHLQSIKQDISETLDTLTNLYLHIRDYSSALIYQLESLQIRRTYFKRDHPYIATSLNNLGIISLNIGDYTNALDYTLESLVIRKNVLITNHPDVASSSNNLAMIYQNIGESKNALKYQLQSLKMRKEIFKTDHHDIAESLHNLAFIYSKNGDRISALKHELQSLEMRKLIFQEEHPDIAASLNNLGIFYLLIGEYDFALNYGKESLQMYQNIFREDHPYIADSLHNLAIIYQKSGDYRTALVHELKSLEMRKTVLKEDHPDLAKSIYNLVCLFQNIGDNQIAATYLSEYRKIQYMNTKI